MADGRQFNRFHGKPTIRKENIGFHPQSPTECSASGEVKTVTFEPYLHSFIPEQMRKETRTGDGPEG